MAETIKLATLVEDMAIYPRERISDSVVAEYARALRSGANMTTIRPIVADAESLRLVDGVHRRRAYLKVFGPGAEAPVELRKYESEADLYLDATALNADHGRRLNSNDRARIILRAKELGISEKDLASALRLPESSVKEIKLQVAVSPVGDSVPLKRAAPKEWRGKQLTEEQVVVHRAMTGARMLTMIRELHQRLDAAKWPLDEHPDLAKALADLRDVIGTRLEELEVPA